MARADDAPRRARAPAEGERQAVTPGADRGGEDAEGGAAGSSTTQLAAAEARRAGAARPRARTRPTRPRPTATTRTRPRSSAASASRACSASSRSTTSSSATELARHGARRADRPAPASPTGSATRALLELALYRFALDRLVRKGFVPVLPPVLVREQAMYGTGFLPTDDVNIYYVERDELYLTGTSEVSLAALHMDEMLAEDACRCATRATRRASGARPARPGRTRAACSASTSSTRSRCSSFVRPEDSSDEHERLLAIEEELVAELGFPYRVVNVAAGDLGASASKKYDIEAWFPRSSATARSRRPRTRRTTRRGGSTCGSGAVSGLDLVHTLNGTAITARSLIAIMENFQDEDGYDRRPFGPRRVRRPHPRRSRRRFRLTEPRRDAGAVKRVGLENR